MAEDPVSRWPAAWAWFAAWFLAGAGCALGVAGAFTIGIFVLPLSAAATAFLATRRTSSVGIAGVISGLGLPVLYIGFLNRDGPGNVCLAVRGGSSCTQEWNPWPLLACGAGLVILGAIVFVRSAHRLPVAQPGPTRG